MSKKEQLNRIIYLEELWLEFCNETRWKNGKESVAIIEECLPEYRRMYDAEELKYVQKYGLLMFP